MTNIDQFESVFKSAAKLRFLDEHIQVQRIMIVTDLDAAETQRFRDEAKELLTVLGGDEVEWQTLDRDSYQSVGELLQEVGKQAPDLICTYRNLYTRATEYPYSLGTYVDVLTQATQTPVVLLRHPGLEPASREPTRGAQTVMAITDHLTGDNHLVSYAARLTSPQGRLFLTHVEDDATFQRYINTISRIPSIETEEARETILEQLLKEPRDYIQSCRDVLADEGLPITVEEVVTIGHRLRDYKKLIEEHEVDLLVLNTKDEDQLAMHGLAYPLAVELRRTPLVLL